MRRRLRIVLVLALASVAADSFATDYPLAGKKLALRTSPAPGTATFASKDAPIVSPSPGGSDDPTQVGASVTIQALPGGAAVTFPLPAAHWTVESPKKTFRFENDGAPNEVSSVRSALLRTRVLKFKSLALGLPLDEPGQAYLVRFTAGSLTWCSIFTSPRRDKAGVFLAQRQAHAPASCNFATATTITTSSTSSSAPSSTTSTTTTTTSTSTTTTLGTCGCGDGVCEATENGASCPEDCLLPRRPTLGLALGDCLFDAYRLSGDCNDLPDFFQQPGDASCWSGTAAEIVAALPAACCAGSVCGGGHPGPAVSISDVVPVGIGNISSVLALLKDCVENQGITEFTIPLVQCGGDCSSPRIVSGFADISITSVTSTGAFKTFDFSAVCSPASPCGLGRCGGAATCETCPEDCGGCAPACS